LALLSNEIQHNLNKWCVTNIKNAGNNLIALFDRGRKVSRFKWRCYSPDALVAEQTAYDTAKKSPNYYTRNALAKVYATGTVCMGLTLDQQGVALTGHLGISHFQYQPVKSGMYVGQRVTDQRN
jgi:hypothetical protein